MKKEITIDGIKYIRADVEQKKENPYGFNDTYPDINLEFYPNMDLNKKEPLEDALNTYLELLSCEGVEEKDEDKRQHILVYSEGELMINLMWLTITHLSPAFDTEANARKAIDRIGEDRLMKMFNVLGGKFDE